MWNSVRKILSKNTDSTENKNLGLFNCNQMKWKVEKRDTIKIPSPDHHDFKFPGARGHDCKLNASPSGFFSSLSFLPLTPMAFEVEIGQSRL